jgi:hypothetical protein
MKLSIQIQLNHHGSTFVPIGAVCVAQTRLAFGKPSKFGNVAVSEVHTHNRIFARAIPITAKTWPDRVLDLEYRMS